MVEIKQEVPDGFSNNHNATRRRSSPGPASVIDLSSSDSDEDDPSDARQRPTKKTRVEQSQGNVPLPVGFLDPLPFSEAPVSTPAPLAMQVPGEATVVFPARTALRTQGSSKQFWKAGDFEDTPSGDWQSYAGGMDHVRVHPRFLHSNATSHKWVLGGFAELLDNALDEVRNGATFASIDMLKNKKDGSRMLLIEDNGGGMDPDKMRQCMSLGYSAKSKIADTIGQYGNGFKTSTMRLGADVLVFSRSYDKDVNRSTQSIGLLSYTFLKETGKEDIVVPMLDYQRQDQQWKAIMRSSASDWENNVDTIIQWSPFSSEADLLDQFSKIKDHGTRIFIYNLWEDDQGLLELDFDTNPHDIQIRGANRDEKHIQMAQEYPNSRHFLTYRHSLRSYASILYLRVPPSFRIILRGEDVEHHNIVNDMMMTQTVTYRPQTGTDGPHRDTNMVAEVTVGFVKDAKAHIDVQGFNVYHKNRLIKPFWRVWHPPGSDGRGVIGVLEANFVEPAHDKQGFERTIVLQRLESKLIQMQKTYWTNYCHKIGYAPRRNKSSMEREREYSPDNHFQPPHKSSKGNASNGKTEQKETKSSSRSKSEQRNEKEQMEHQSSRSRTPGRRLGYSEESSQSDEDVSDYDVGPSRRSHGKDGSSTKPTRHKEKVKDGSEGGKSAGITSNAENGEFGKGSSHLLKQLTEENRVLKERLRKKEEEFLGDLLKDLDQERTKCKTLEAELLVAKKKIEELNEEQENLIDLFSEERQRHETEEENLRKKLKDASNTIQELVDKVGRMGKMKSSSSGKAK